MRMQPSKKKKINKSYDMYFCVYIQKACKKILYIHFILSSVTVYSHPECKITVKHNSAFYQEVVECMSIRVYTCHPSVIWVLLFYNAKI